MSTAGSAAPAVDMDPNDNPETRRSLKKVVAASMAGTVVEWYEFFLFATASTLVFGPLFFVDTGNPLDGIIKAFLIYAVGFIARPLGGIVFGHFGDKFGRKHLLQVALSLIHISEPTRHFKRSRMPSSA